MAHQEIIDPKEHAPAIKEAGRLLAEYEGRINELLGNGARTEVDRFNNLKTLLNEVAIVQQRLKIMQMSFTPADNEKLNGMYQQLYRTLTQAIINAPRYDKLSGVFNH